VKGCCNDCGGSGAAGNYCMGWVPVKRRDLPLVM
jgi:hypothetical protein